MQILFPVLALLALNLVVFIHEMGHWLIFRLLKVPTPVFSIGFGKPLWSRKFGSTRFQIAPIPLGGYVRPLDQSYVQSLSEIEQSQLQTTNPEFFDERNWFEKRSGGVKFLSYLGGPAANLAFAALAYFILLLPAEKLPLPGPPSIKEVVAESVAESAGVQPGDTLLEINGRTIDSVSEGQMWLYQALQVDSGSKLTLKVLRSDATLSLETEIPQLQAQKDDSKPLRFGVSLAPSRELEDPSVLDIAIAGTREVGDSLWLQTEGIAAMFTGEVSHKDISGPVGMVQFGSRAASGGIISLLGFAIMISIALAWFNLLPIPMLDGFGMLLGILEMLRGQRLSDRTEFMLKIPGIVFLGALMFFALFNDVARLIS